MEFVSTSKSALMRANMAYIFLVDAAKNAALMRYPTSMKS